MTPEFSLEKQKFFLLAFTQELILNSGKPEIPELKEIIKKRNPDLENSVDLNQILTQQKSQILTQQSLIKSKETQINKENNEKKEELVKEKISNERILSEERLSEEKTSSSQNYKKEELVKIDPLKKTNIILKDISAKEDRFTKIKPAYLKKSLTKVVKNQIEDIPEPKLPPHLAYLKPIPSRKMNIDLLKLNPFLLDPAVKVITANPNERVIVDGKMGVRPTSLILTKEDIKKIIDRISEYSRIPAREGIYRVVVGNISFSAIISSVIGSKFVLKKMDYSDYISSELKR